MWQLPPPASLLLLVAAGMQAADLPKAMLLLDPIWNRVLRMDSVTLKCEGAHPAGNSSTQWWHNDSLISNKAPSYFITAAKDADSGDYRCQTGLSALSDPVQLDVHPDWLLLQASQWVYQEGDTIWLRCHSWKNTPVHKVQYFQDGIGRMFFHNNSEFHIPKAARKHSGSYFCRGIIGKKNESSEAVNITVQGPAIPSTSPFFLPWRQITFCLMMGLMFALDTGLYFSVRRDLQRSARDWRSGKVTWSQDS